MIGTKLDVAVKPQLSVRASYIAHNMTPKGKHNSRLNKSPSYNKRNALNVAVVLNPTGHIAHFVELNILEKGLSELGGVLCQMRTRNIYLPLFTTV